MGWVSTRRVRSTSGTGGDLGAGRYPRVVTSEIHATAAALVARDGQRYTPVRQALVEALEATEQPLTIPELLSRRPELAQSSAYRNLNVLETAGVVSRIVVGPADEHAHYELSEDFTQHHHHLICEACGSVGDFVVPHDVEELLDRALARVARKHRFVAARHRLDLIGICSRCR